MLLNNFQDIAFNLHATLVNRLNHQKRIISQSKLIIRRFFIVIRLETMPTLSYLRSNHILAPWPPVIISYAVAIGVTSKRKRKSVFVTLLARLAELSQALNGIPSRLLNGTAQ